MLGDRDNEKQLSSTVNRTAAQQENESKNLECQQKEKQKSKKDHQKRLKSRNKSKDRKRKRYQSRSNRNKNFENKNKTNDNSDSSYRPDGGFSSSSCCDSSTSHDSTTDENDSQTQPLVKQSQHIPHNANNDQLKLIATQNTNSNSNSNSDSNNSNTGNKRNYHSNINTDVYLNNLTVSSEDDNEKWKLSKIAYTDEEQATIDEIMAAVHSYNEEEKKNR